MKTRAHNSAGSSNHEGATEEGKERDMRHVRIAFSHIDRIMEMSNSEVDTAHVCMFTSIW